MISARLHAVFTNRFYAPRMDDRPSILKRCDCSDASLEREGSVPVSGFSRELRSSPDATRYRFAFALRGGFDTPVHMVFSLSARRAEIKAGDLKVHVVDDAACACDARRRWIAWWRRGRSAGGFSPPRRTGRVPLAMRPTS